MKNRVIAVILAGVFCAALSACAGKEGNVTGGLSADDVSSAIEDGKIIYEEIKAKNQVKLPDYKNMTFDVDYAVFDEDSIDGAVKTDMEGIVEYYGLYDFTPVDKDTVESGDVVNIDYCGRKDGVAFDGGTAMAYHLAIGSGTFIPGFEDGLIGAKVGEAVDLPLKFPDDYGNADLAGAEVVFTVSVNSIDEQKMPEIDDDFVKEYGAMFYGEEVTDYASLKEYYKKSMQDACDERNEGFPGAGIFEAIYKETNVESTPQEMIDQAEKESLDYYERMAASYGVDLEGYATGTGYESLDAFKAENLEVVKNDAAKRLVYLAIAQSEGIKMDDKSIDEFVEKRHSDFGYENGEEMKEKFSPETLWIYALEDKVNDYLAENVGYTKKDKNLLEIVNGVE